MEKLRLKAASNRRGQALIEYVLLLSILIFVFSLLLESLAQTGAMQSLKKPLEKDFVYTYRYGHPKARGQEDGGPKYIPTYNDPQNFRIFINPPISP